MGCWLCARTGTSLNCLKAPEKIMVRYRTSPPQECEDTLGVSNYLFCCCSAESGDLNIAVVVIHY